MPAGRARPSVDAIDDADGERPLGERSYTLHMAAGVPAANYWSLVVYDAETRCLLDNGNGFASIASNQNLTLNPDGSADLHFGPEPPADGTGNWIKTVPGRNWFGGLRLYGPTQAFFDRAWTPGDLTKDTSGK